LGRIRGNGFISRGALTLGIWVLSGIWVVGYLGPLVEFGSRYLGRIVA
jgi:hypothetical protein